MRLIGYFLAEGFVNGRSVKFAFSEEEIEYHGDLKNLMLQAFGVEAKIYPYLANGKSIVFAFHSVKAVEFFSQFGKTAKNKYIPQWIMFLPFDLQKQLLKGYWRGNGCQTVDGFNIDTASCQLAEDIKMISLRLGMIPSKIKRMETVVLPMQESRVCRESFNRIIYKLCYRGKNAKILSEILCVETQTAANRSYTFIANGYAHYPIRDISSSAVENLLVYNLEVAGEQSYICEGVAVHNCVRVLAETIASLPLHVYRRLEGSKGKEKAPEHYLYPVLHEIANPEMTSFELRETMVGHLCLRGNAYAEKVFDRAGRVKELWPLNPDGVLVERDKATKQLIYIITLPGESRQVKLSSDRILHIRGLSGNGIIGYSPIALAKESIGLALATEEYGSRFFGNASRPSGVLEHPGKLGKDAADRLKKSWEEMHRGLSNAHRVAILEEGLKWNQIGMTQEDSQYLQCVIPGTMISMADGTRKEVEKIKKGDIVIGYDKGKYVAARVSATGNIQKKRLIKITTARGRTLTASYDHPCLALKRLRTPGGRIANRNPEWIKMDDLQVGYYLKIGLGFPEKSIEQKIAFQEAYLLGALIGDGYLRAGSCMFSSKDDGVSLRVNNILSLMGASLKKKKGENVDWGIITGGSGRGRKGNEFRKFINKSGLVGKHSHDKTIPEYIFTGGKDAWIGFLSGYFDTDGTIKSINEKAQPVLSFSSINRKLLEECQYLLSLLGVQSAIYKTRDAGMRHVLGKMCNIKAGYCLNIAGFSQVRKASTLLNLAHKTKSIRLKEYEEVKDSIYTIENVLYDRIKKIEQAGDGKTVGLEIEGCHTHITNGIITHNTRQYQVVDIARIFRVPPHMIAELTRATYSNIESQSIDFVVNTIRPWLVRFEQAFKQRLFDETDREHYAEFLIDGLLRGDIASRYSAYAVGRQWGWLSADDIREMENRNPLPDGQGETYLVPLNMIPAGETAKIGDIAKEPPKSEDKKQKTREIFTPIMKDVGMRIVRRERADILQMMRKSKDMGSFTRRLDGFWEEHQSYIRKSITPVFRSYGNAAWYDDDEIEASINLYTTRHINNLKNQIITLTDSKNYDTTTLENALEAVFNELESEATGGKIN